MSSRRRLSLNLTNSAHKALRFDSVNKILKIDRGKRQKKDALNKQVARIALADLLKSNSTSREYNEPPDFKVFLSQPENVDIFREFLEAHYCQENLDFFLACEKFRTLDPDRVGNEMVKFMANQIYNDYLKEDARHPVNVNQACVQHIRQNLKSPRLDLLCDAQTEIYELMRTDCYPRFCKTWEMDKVLAERILNKHPVIKHSGSNQSSTSSSILTTSVCSSRSTGPMEQTPSPAHSASTRSTRSSNISSGTSCRCPPECPYFRIGRLPCQRHRRLSPLPEVPYPRKRQPESDPLSRVDLRRIHQVPAVCIEDNGLPQTLMASPPPPPLPPKPDAILKGNKRNCPYVGKVFEV